MPKMTYSETNISKNINLYSLYPFALLKTRSYLSTTVGDKNILGTKIFKCLGRVFLGISHFTWECAKAIFDIGVCNKFRDQLSVKGRSRQWEEFQKVRAGRILTTEISMCVDKRYLYFFLDRKNTKCWTKSYSLERKSVQYMVGIVIMGVEKGKLAQKLFYLS